MKKSVIFTTKTVFLACFTFFLFNQFVFAADAGCHTQNGCGTNESDIFNVNAYSEPSYAPSWTNVTTSSKVYGGQYIKFAVTEGNIYVWTTEGPEDYFSGTYSATCSSDSDCEDGKLSCIGGYCLLPFDTELTLLEGNTCSANSNFLAYSNQDGFRNQSSLEWKATFTGIVTLLVTNYEYQTATGSFVGCKKTPSTMNTTVKWQRSASEHCDTCDAPADYKKVVTNGTDEPAHAPSWTTVQSKDWIDLTDLSAENVAKIAAADANWIKPGSYLVFDVKESEIYRWSTCASVFYDTQLSLFKGEGTNGDCGQFLAYGDDSQVSYKVGETNYCPAGTKQTVLEWQANFTGKVTLLLNEYNCYQCYKRSVTGYNQWAHCFEVTETYKKDANGNVLIGADTFPVLADASTADNEKITMTYMYAFPIDWQRYDCNTCTAGSPVAKIADFATSSGWQDFATGGSQTLENGQYMTFSLKRGSKYLFKASKASSLITIKDGDSCNGKTLAQGKGQLTYFADAEATSTDKDPNKYPDIITVLVSNAECVAGSNTLTYLYYGTTGKVQDRYETSNVTGGKMYTDNTTALKFVDTGDWAATWKQAIEKCETYAVSSSSSIVPCPLPVCPSNNHTPVQGVDKYCKYNGDGSCSAPICDTGYKEYPKSSQTYIYSDSWGSCYFKPDLSAMDICYGVGLAKCFNLTPTSLEWNKTINCATKECIRKNNHIDMVTECPDGYTYNSSDGKCYGDGGEAYDIYLDPASSDVPDAQLQSVSSSNVSIEGLNGSSCPSGMQLIDGVCKYETCGQYAPVSFFITKNGVVYHKNPANGCYQTQSTSGALYPCCCDQPIYKFYGTSIQATYEASTMPYVDSEGNYQSAWTCTDTVPCQEGYLYGAHTNKCYKCNEEGFNYIFYTGYDYKCASCSPDEDLMCVDDDPGNGGEVVRKYITCEDGFVAVQDGGDWKCVACDASTTPVKISGNWKCERECAGTVQNNKCYTSVTNKVEKCPSGWIEDPQNSNLCRKLNGEYVHCAKSTAVLKDNNGIYDGVTFETCNVSKPNSVDCDCFYDRCETGFTDADRKVCPATYTYGGHSYPVTPKTDSDGFVTGCTFNDSTGTACGEAVGGWFLPNINQLYSIVDFDLYDPATALPFSGGGYVRDELCKDASGKGVPCSSSVTTPKDCTPSEADPFGDAQCGLNGENGDGHYICMDGKCVRNNWYWSSTTVVSENADDGKFIWSVNMQDGRSYRAVKGCVDAEDCAANPGLNARSHKVMCIKGSSISGIFDSDAPSNSQTFSGWTCNKSAETKKLQVYFEIIDSSSGGKDVVALLGDSDLIDLIPGFAHKGIKYGETDITPTTSYLPGKQAEIYNNCGYPQNPAPHAFEVKWNGEITAGKEAVANVIRSIQTKECSNDIINAVYEGQNVDTSNCAVPPYFVTAYAVDASESAASAVAISPTNRPFVFTNRCGDKYMTYDGSYTENCEADSFDKICAYGNSECQLCAQTDIGSVKACTLYSATPPDCMDGTLQSQFCDNGTISEGHAGSGMSCEYYDFIGTGIPGQTEDCDCNGGTYYLYTDENTFNCNTPLASKICPDYYTGTGTDHCYICSGCKREKVAKARCGDGILQKSSCPGDDPDCQEVPGANEECDDGNGSNTDGCTNECKFPKCGDGYIQTNMGEVCDSGEFNGYYATNCDGTNACPGCAGKECGKNGTDPLGPRCGDGFVQNVNDCPTKYNAEGYGFASVAECQQKLAGAAEVCDLAAGNGKPVTFADFIANSTDDVSFCVQEIDGVVYPVNTIHEKYGECVYLYKQYVSAHPGCASDCSAAIAPYCGDGTKDSNENCDLSLPTVNLINGKYLVAEKDSFNGKAYGYCKLDCSGTYKCNNNIRETSDCADKTEDNFCPSIGDGNILYVKGGIEQCDDGILNGSYGNCAEDCSGRAYCGNGNKVDATQLGDCIEKNEDGSCALREECDFGTQNQTIGNAYSVNKHGSCISEDEECTKGVDDWEGRICCKYGRYCGDGTVDNGEGLGLADSKEWLNASNWVVSAENAASVVSEPRELAVQFVLNGASATAELNIAMPIETLAGHPDKTLRYMIEYDIKAIKSADETVKISSGVNEYDESGILTGASSNASPYFVVNKDLEISDSNIWKHARTGSYVSGFAAGASYQWYTGTKFVKILLKMEGADGTEFYLRGLKFFALENGNPKSVGGASEMCDPGEDNFVEKGGENDSRKYMEQCQAGCLWTYYCGDDKIQRSENCNGYDSEKCEVVSGAEEVCDNGTNAHNVYNGCEPGCFELGPHCGDGIVDHLISCDGCNVPVSGLLKDEVCDRGVFNSILPLGADRVVDITNYNKETSANACRDNCMVPRCGDGILDAVVMYNSVSGQYETVEECDCGVAGSYYDSTKLQKTSITVSGEIKEIELCVKSDGTPLYNTNDGGRAAVCRPNCKISRCGDGILDPEEECDDGNFDDHDSCNKKCKKTKCGDNIFSYKRSYLCEELIGKNAVGLTDMAAKGVIDCCAPNDTNCTYGTTCASLLGGSEAVVSQNNVVDWFSTGILHCCYNMKLENNTVNDRNCEINFGSDSDPDWKTPRDIALENCTTYAYKEGANNAYSLMDEDECSAAGYLDSLEMCESCLDEDCGCSERYPDTTSPNYHKCIDQNRYCDKTCWNRIGECGDGRIDNGEEGSGTIDAGEVCDNHQKGDAGSYTDIYGRHPIPGGNKGIGSYCTGAWVGTGTPDSERPMCGGTVTTDCWSKGCSQKTHGGLDGSESKCRDGIVDVYAGEECDEKSGGDYETNWCSPDCKWNVKDGVTAGCGDGVVQENSNEVCDDGNDIDTDYCINNCHTYYGYCGDGKITGPGFNMYDTLVTLPAPNQAEGPEDCDPEDARTKSLVNAGITVTTMCSEEDCLKVATCGNNSRNPRFEGCDCWTSGNQGNHTCEYTFERTIGSDQIKTVCHNDCTADPVGQVFAFNPGKISGWACDPDHPMTHRTKAKGGMVKVEFFNKLNTELKNPDYTQLVETNEDVPVDKRNNVTVICGGGELHGWEMNPSSLGLDLSKGPYTIKVYALTLDKANAADSDDDPVEGDYSERNTLIGTKTNFITAMSCGDNVISNCSDILVTLADGTETTWKDGWICKDGDGNNGVDACANVTCAQPGCCHELQGTCASYGLTSGAVCVNEACDNGFANNSDAKECSSKCQITSCGDGLLQDQVTERTKEECDKNSPRPKVFCNGTAESGGYPAVGAIVTADIAGSTIGSEEATCVNNDSDDSKNCKWDRSACTITSPCPALSTVVGTWGGNYKSDKAAQYIRYVDNGSTYKRNWDSAAGKWQDQESLKYKTDANAVCKFECTDNLVWNTTSRKCEPREDLSLSCVACGDDFGIWKGSNPEASCISTAKTVSQTVTINTDGDVEISPAAVATEYNSDGGCGWTCNSSSQYHSSLKKCFEIAKYHPCSLKVGDETLTDLSDTNYRWVKVLKECDDNGENCKVKLDGTSAELTIAQGIGSETTTGFNYDPLDADLVSYALNDTDNGAKNQLAQLDTAVAKRCFYTCADTNSEGKYLYWDPQTQTCLSATDRCGNGIIENEDCDTVTDTGATCVLTPEADEICDDQTFNGQYGSINETSYCRNDCKGRIGGGKYFCGDGLVQYNTNETSVTTWNFDDGKIPVNFAVMTIDDNRSTVVKNNQDLTNVNRATINTLKGWELATGSIGSGLPSALGNYSLCSMNGKSNPNYSATNYFRNTHADVVLTVNSAGGGTLKFKYTGSSEIKTAEYDTNYDYFVLLVDGTDQSNSTVRKLHTRGENHTTWDEYSLDLAAGEHTIIFRYYKDWGTDSNADRYCIDEIQFETSSTCQGLSCSGVSGDTYPGANMSDLTSEECDPSDPGITSGSDKRTKLCNSKLGLNVESYHNSGTIGCGEVGANNACRITGNFSDPSADNYPCGYCGDGYENGNEQCDISRNYTKDQLCQGKDKTYSSPKRILSFAKLSDTVVGIENAKISLNKSTKSDGSAGNINGWYVDRSVNVSYDDGSSVVLARSTHQTPLCSRNWGDNGYTNEIEFSIVPEASGEICFWWKGQSEAGADKFTYKLNGETKFDGISGYYNEYQQQCETVTAGSTYTFYFKYSKNGSTHKGIDMFCIDDISVPVQYPHKTLFFKRESDSEITIEDATINYNKSTNSNGTTGNANGWYLSANRPAETVVHSTHPASLCARNYGDANRTNEIEFTLTPKATGEICFWWVGESQADADKFTYKFNGETRFDGISGSYLTYQQQCESVTAGSTYTFYFKYSKDGSTNIGIDIFCIDDITVPDFPYNPSTISCNSSCQKTGTCYTYCGDGEIQSDKEECEYVDGAVSFGSNMDSEGLCESSDSKTNQTQNCTGNKNFENDKNNSGVYISTGGIVEWPITNTGIYEIEALGASGGNGYYISGGSLSRTNPGCKGALVRANYKLKKGQKLRLLAGKRGGQRNFHGDTRYTAGGGGGGSFVVLCEQGDDTCSNPIPLVIAGGGGGASGKQDSNGNSPCGVGIAGPNAMVISSGDTVIIAGGSNGADGANSTRAHGGLGWSSHNQAFTGATPSKTQFYGTDDGDNDEPHGGFGGGGNAIYYSSGSWYSGYRYYCHAGGGGGYSGGCAGIDSDDYSGFYGGGGGASYVGGFDNYLATGAKDSRALAYYYGDIWRKNGDDSAVTATSTGDGKITIKMVKYPGCTRGCRISDSDFVNCGSRTAGCINVPENAVLWGSSIISQEWKQVNGSWQWSPSNEGTYSSDTSSTECSFHCRAGYVWENSKCILDVVCTDGFHKEHGECVLNTQYDIPCEGQPDDPNNHAHWNAPGNPPTITQEWICENDNCAWSPRAIGEFKQETNASYCYFSCDTGYHWDKNTQKCEDNTRTTDCDPLPNIDSEWNDNGAGGTFTQNWNTSLASCTDPLNDPENCWEPASMGSVYNNETAGTCRYKCKSGYVWISSKGKCLKTFMSFENNGDDTSSELMLTSTSGDYKWERLTSSGNDGIGTVTGSYSMCSTNKGNHGSTSTMTVKVDMPEDGYFTFYVKGEGEGLYSDNYDRLNFYVDDTLSSDVVGVNFNSDGNVSGWRSWSKKVVYLTAGEHTLQFDYKKDGTTHRGKDRFCIDDLRLEFGSVEWPNCSSNIGSLCKHNGLFWSESSSSTKTWSDANSSCSGMGTGWRLPTINELRSLVQNCSATQLGGSCQLSDPDCLNWNNCGGSTTCKPNCSNVSVIGDTIKLWSSSRDTSESSEWYLSLDFSNGKLGSNGGSSNNLNYRCVYPAN